MITAHDAFLAGERYASRNGWQVFPLRPNGKAPLTRRGLHDATSDPRALERLFAPYEHANLGVRTGAPSRIVVLDIDGDEGADSLRQLEDRHAKLPRTASVRTPRGQHYYLRHPGGTVPNSAGAIAPGIDIRGDGGYVVAPPSVVDSRAYEVDEQAPLAAMPAWLAQATTRPVAPPAAPVTDWLEVVCNGLGEGERNAGLTRLVGHLLARDVDARLVAELAHVVNVARCRPPLPAREVAQIVESIAGREIRKRARAVR